MAAETAQRHGPESDPEEEAVQHPAELEHQGHPDHLHREGGRTAEDHPEEQAEHDQGSARPE